MKRFSIDIESLSLEPNALVLSIGAVLFDRHNGVEAEYYTAINGAEQQDTYGRHLSHSTVMWWLSQTAMDPATAAVFANPVGVKTALEGLRDFVAAHTTMWADPYEVWFQGPQFDAVAIGSLCKAADVQVPWRYNAVRDLRTLLAMARAHGTTDEALERGIGSEYHAHNALDDAKMQAIRCINALDALGLE